MQLHPSSSMVENASTSRRSKRAAFPRMPVSGAPRRLVQFLVAITTLLATGASFASCDELAPALIGAQMGSTGGAFPSDVKVSTLYTNPEFDYVVKEIVGSHDGIPDQVAWFALWKGRLAWLVIQWKVQSPVAAASVLQRLAALTGDQTLTTVSSGRASNQIPPQQVACESSTAHAELSRWGESDPHTVTLSITIPLTDELTRAVKELSRK